MPTWKPGMLYDVGGAAALFWPDQHPEHPDPELAQRWLVFDPWGGLDIIIGRLPREDLKPEHEISLMPFLSPPEEPSPDWETTKQKLASLRTSMRVREFWREIRSTPTEAQLDELAAEAERGYDLDRLRRRS